MFAVWVRYSKIEGVMLLESQGNDIRDKDSLQAHSVPSCTITSTAYFDFTQMAAKIFLQHAPKNTHAYLVSMHNFLLNIRSL